jgi:hypothetical protein
MPVSCEEAVKHAAGSRLSWPAMGRVLVSLARSADRFGRHPDRAR